MNIIMLHLYFNFQYQHRTLIKAPFEMSKLAIGVVECLSYQTSSASAQGRGMPE